jgi:carbamoyltransferase
MRSDEAKKKDASRALEPFPCEKACEVIEEADLTFLREKLAAAGYTERAVCRSLGIPDIWQQPQDLRIPLLLRFALKGNTPLEALVRFFYLTVETSIESVQAVFTREEIAFLENAGLCCVQEGTGTIRSRVVIFPCGTLFIATDPFSHRRDLALPRPEEPVMYLGRDSYVLARGAVRDDCESVLDLCTGSGVHALLAASHGRRVVGVDINERALAFAAFNARLNGIQNAEFLRGDLYEPLAPGEFDLILANPPFVASPDGLLYGHGGESGEDVLSRIISGLPRRLRRGGFCHIITDYIVGDMPSFPERIRRWLGEKGFDILLLRVARRDPFMYVSAHCLPQYMADFHAYRKRAVAWAESLLHRGVKWVDFGLLTLRRRHDGEEGGSAERELKRIDLPVGAAVKAFFLRRDAVEEEDFRERFYDEIADFQPGLRFSPTFRVIGGRLVPERLKIGVEGAPLPPDSATRPDAFDLLRFVDGKSRIGKGIEDYLRQKGMAGGADDPVWCEARDSCRDFLLDLYVEGYLTLCASTTRDS